MKAWPVLGILLIQIILLLAHWFLFHTWIAFWPGLSPTARVALRGTLFVLAFTFVPATLLSFRFSHGVISFFYKLAAIWLGFLHFLFMGACMTWLTWYGMLAFRESHGLSARRTIAGGWFALALLVGIFGLLNARWIRVRRISIRLPHLPSSWHGRKAVMMSDLHLGNVNGAAFCRRMVRLAGSFHPDVVFIPGDLFDGSRGNLDEMLAPLKALTPPLGSYFSTGNHEEFHDPADYMEAITRAGVRVLANQRVTVDGLEVLGISYGTSTDPTRARSTLEGLSPGTGTASILLNHAPIRLPIVEQSGVSLQLSGHTHGGQIFPFTWLTHRIFGRFTHGLHRFGALQVYTSTGAGTWGPPMRIGSQPEIVVLAFERAAVNGGGSASE
ncbi:MAG TPA: metallophosphoesterase [Terracidiphilus sp.]